MELDARARNALIRSGLRSVGDVVVLGESGIKTVHNIGQKSYDIIIAALNRVKVDWRDIPTPVVEAIDTIKRSEDELESIK